MVDAVALARELESALEGDVRFDAAHRALYAHDASHYRQVPIGVVLPRTKEDVVRAVAICRRYGVPLLGRGAGTSIGGQCCNVAVVLDFSRYMNRVLEIDQERRFARVEPGCILDDLRNQANVHGLTFGPDPASHSRCVLGGMIGNNAGGVHSVMAQWHTGPRTSDNLHRLEVLTYDGARFWVGPTSDEEFETIVGRSGRQAEILRALHELRDRYGDEIRARFPRVPRRASGYNLDDLLPEHGFHVARALAGTEGTCVLYLEAELHLIPEPPVRRLLVAGFHDVYQAARQVPLVLEWKPIGLEGMDDRLVQAVKRKGMGRRAISRLPKGGGWLLVELGGESGDEVSRRAEGLKVRLEEEAPPGAVSARIITDPAEEAELWQVREASLGATSFVPGMKLTWEGWEDSAVPPERLADYLLELRRLLDAYGYEGVFYGHFGHGLVHSRIDFDLESRRGVETFLRFIHEAAALVTRFGGTLSGEHGDGQARGTLLVILFGPQLMEAFHRFKQIWDPDGRMNPGKLIDAYLPDQHLLLGPEWLPPTTDTYFSFPSDQGSFSNASIRCVGVGKCREKSGGTMCPSYMVTLEEEHSTRGRARLLHEMLRGEVITDGWRSREVHEALDLCLACKGCKHECPVTVDVATYKAEFRAHYYRGRLRPRQAYAFGWIWWWARLAAHAPGLVNWLTHSRPFATLAHWAAGAHPARPFPRLADRTFRSRFLAERESANSDGPVVIFWADTFTNHFHPESALAAVRVLERLGYRVVVPRTDLCCGRPLYDYGFLGLARKLLTRILDELGEQVMQGVKIVGVEPSCIATFRDELTGLLPHDRRAQRLKEQTFLLSEFLDIHAADADLGRLTGTALLHGHCHQKAVLDFGAAQRVLERLGLELEIPDSGCCGMAGPFGFERAHYEVAQACGERVLLPAVRSRPPETLVVTDGFSCRMQIEHNVEGAHPLNVADVVWRAMAANGALSRGS